MDFYGFWSFGCGDGADALDGVDMGKGLEGGEGGEELRFTFTVSATSAAKVLRAYHAKMDGRELYGWDTARVNASRTKDR